MNTDGMQELKGWRRIVYCTCADTVVFLVSCITSAIFSLFVIGSLMLLEAEEDLAYATGMLVCVGLLTLLLWANHYYDKHLKGRVFFVDEGI